MRLLVRFVVAAVAVGALAGCEPPGPSATVTPRHVDVFGDSLTVFSEDDYAAINPGIDTTFHAFGGATTADWADEIAHTSGPIVLALGTNDINLPDVAGTWSELLAAIPASACVIWVRPADDRTPGEHRHTDTNALIADEILARSSFTFVYPWRGIAAPHPEWYLPDLLHHTAQGEAEYAKALLAAADTCA